MTRHFNEGIYRRVIAMRRMGCKQKAITHALGIAQGTVSKVLKINRETVVPTPRARPGRPSKTTEREDRYLVRLCRNGRTKSTNSLRAEWLRFTNTHVSRILVNLPLIHACYFAKWPLKKLLLLQRHRQERMDWARKHLRWRLGHWQHVLFSDEAYSDNCIVPRVQSGVGGVTTSSMETWISTSTYRFWRKRYCHLLVWLLGIIVCKRITTRGLTELA